MRISDWSSDVCSSDLDVPGDVRRPVGAKAEFQCCGAGRGLDALGPYAAVAPAGGVGSKRRIVLGIEARAAEEDGPCLVWLPGRAFGVGGEIGRRHSRWQRSEEHTSELQSQMGI